MVALAPIPMTEARDGLGRRIARIAFPAYPAYSRRTDYYYSTAWQVLEECDESQPQYPDVRTEDVRYQYVWDPRYIDALVCRDENKNADTDCTDAATGVQGSNTGDEHLYYTHDANFNVTALVDGYDGAVVQRYLYDPYGQPSVRNGVRDAAGADTRESEWAERASNLFENDILFCGYRLLDGYSGVYDVRNRMYHPTLGRWLQRDPIGYVDATNLYGYVRSDPVGRRDPRGLEAIKEDMFGYRALTWDDFTPGTIEGSAWASIATSFDEDLGELDRVTRVCVDDRFCSGAKPSPSTKCYQCFTSWKKCTRLRAVTDPTHSVKDLSKEKLGGAVPPWVSWTRN